MEDWTDTLSRNVGKDGHHCLPNNPEERRSHLLRGGNLRSLTKNCSGSKQPEREANHSPAFSTEACNEWIYTSDSTIRLPGADRDKFTFFIESAVRVTIM